MNGTKQRLNTQNFESLEEKLNILKSNFKNLKERASKLSEKNKKYF